MCVHVHVYSFFGAMVQVLPRSPKLKRKGQAMARILVHVYVFLCHCIGPKSTEQQAEKKPRGHFAAMT